jgi:multiple sugar transport system permease protein/fructooligosaccharide transport system permease protein
MEFLTPKTKARLNTVFVIVLFLLPTVVGLGLFQFIPLVSAVRNSFYDTSLLNPSNKSFIGFDNYIRLINDSRFLGSIKTTLLFTGGILLFQVPLGLILALVVQRKRPGMGLLRSAIFVPVVTAITVSAVIWNLMYNPENGLLNTFLAFLGLPRQPFLTSASQALPSIIVMSIWQEVGLTMTLFLAGLKGIPNEFYDAAEIDGANRLQLFWHITLPLLRRTITYTIISSTIFSFTVFASVYVMTKGGPNNSTRVVIYHIYEQAFRLNEIGYASAQALVLMVIMAAIALVQGRLLRTDLEY